MSIFRLPRNFESQIEWQWRITRIATLVIWPVVILVVTAFRAAKAGPAAGETIAQGAIMIGGGFLVFAGAWFVKTVVEALFDFTGRKQ